MNLAWIVAVLRPLDIAPHPNFRDPEYDSSPPAQLAGIVSGDPSRWSRLPVEGEEDRNTIDQAVYYASLSFTTQGLRAGFNGLVLEAQRREQDDARNCALALLACCAAAELEEYEEVDGILAEMLSRLSFDTPEGKLLRVALLQQKSLRFRDTGREFAPLTSEVLSLLDEISDSDFSEFPTSSGSSIGHAQSIRHVITALRHAAWSLAPFDRGNTDGDAQAHAVPSWQEIVRTPKSNQALKIDQLRASEYAKFVQVSYNQVFRSRARTFGGGGAPTLFYASLNFELLGDAAVYRLRKESALLKLLQCASSGQADAEEVADSLRLLRHSNAKSELDLAVERVRASGPLEALKKESAQILLHRRESHMIRAPELRVLRGAADLMGQQEALEALQVILGVIESGGAQPAPGTSQLDVVRLEPAWLTAAQLSNIANECDKVAILLLQSARDSCPGDQLRDKAIGRALHALNWETVSAGTQEAWDTFFEEGVPDMPTSRRVFEVLTSSRQRLERAQIENLEDVANRVNAAMSGHPMASSDLDTSVAVVEESLAQIRTTASRGAYSFHMIDPADVAAALIIHCDATGLWSTLSEFLTDGKVQRSDKSDALDRLAHRKLQIPREVLATFQRHSEVLLNSSTEYFDDDAVSPFPAALRFLASQAVMAEDTAFSLIAQMFGRGEPESRVEASRTVAALATSLSSHWVLAQAMQFSHDSEPAVRGNAARALSIYSAEASEFGETAQRRLTEMMRGEAILVPLLTIRQIRQIPEFPSSAKREIGHLAAIHPSAIVRKEAMEMMSDAG